MRYHWGHAVGHMYSHQHPETCDNELSCSNEAEVDLMDEAVIHDREVDDGVVRDDASDDTQDSETFSIERGSNTTGSDVNSTNVEDLEYEEMYGDTREYDVYD